MKTQEDVQIFPFASSIWFMEPILINIYTKKLFVFSNLRFSGRSPVGLLFSNEEQKGKRKRKKRKEKKSTLARDVRIICYFCRVFHASFVMS